MASSSKIPHVFCRGANSDKHIPHLVLHIEDFAYFLLEFLMSFQNVSSASLDQETTDLLGNDSDDSDIEA